MTSRATHILEQFSVLEDIYTHPNIQPVLQKVQAVKFKSDEDRNNWIERIKMRFGPDVADLVDQYAGKEGSSYPSTMTPALKDLITNVNGIISGNPG